MNFTLFGINTQSSEVQFMNIPILKTSKPSGILRKSKFWQLAKAYAPIFSTLCGMSIYFKLLRSEKALSHIILVSGFTL